MHQHDHDHGHHHHHHVVDLAHASRSLVIGIVLNLAFVVIEFGAGWFSGSLALLSDAGHNLSDVASLGLALLAFRLFKFKPTLQYTYGYRKASILISLLNAVILLLVVAGIGYESVQRFISPEPVKEVAIIVVAAAGILINTASALLFFRNKESDLNLKGAYLHLMVDALVSVGVVVAGIVIHFTGWLWLDPLISLVIMAVIVVSTWNLLQDSLRLALDAVPKNIDVESIRQAAIKLPGIKDIHHIHVWAISTSDNALTAHVVVDDDKSQEEVSRIKDKLRHELEHFGIRHATIETESNTCSDSHQNTCDSQPF
jgi:cobalt-zinc-cadmium efflux system protein